MPRDVREQQAKLARAQGLAFVAPVYWLGFPAILKGWFERVFTPGFAYSLSAEGWRKGSVNGRVPLLKHDKALVMSTTLFRRADYEAGLAAPMTQTVDDFGLRYPGVKHVDHVYFYGVPVVDDSTRRGYLEQAHRLGTGFASARGGSPCSWRPWPGSRSPPPPSACWRPAWRSSRRSS